MLICLHYVTGNLNWGGALCEFFYYPKIVDHFRRRAPILELGNLDGVRGFTDVRSVVRQYRVLLKAGYRAIVFNVCLGQGYALLEVRQMMREQTAHDLVVQISPVFVCANEVRRMVGSCVKVRPAIGPVPDVALRGTLQWMLENHA